MKRRLALAGVAVAAAATGAGIAWRQRRTATVAPDSPPAPRA